MRRIGSLSLLAASLLAAPADAVPLTFSYEGIVSVASGPSGFGDFLNELIRVDYTFESTTADSNASANGDYLGAVTSLSVTVGANLYSATSGNIIIINAGTNPDQYIVDVPTGLTGPSVGGLPVSRIEVILTDTTMTFFSSDALPIVQPDPSAFDQRSIQLQFNLGDDPYGLIAAADVQISPAVVPEPSTLVLLGAGLVAVGRRVRSRRT